MPLQVWGGGGWTTDDSAAKPAVKTLGKTGKTPSKPTDLEREKSVPAWRADRAKPPNGGTLSKNAWNVLDRVSARVGHNLQVQQGGHNVSGDPTSKGTHDGGGAVDLFVKGMSKQQRLNAVAELRANGAAAWLRTPEYGWNNPDDEHIHAIFMDDPELAPVARSQVKQYKQGLNGLANKAPDPFKNLKITTTSQLSPVSNRSTDLERERALPAVDEEPLKRKPQLELKLPEGLAALMRKMTTTSAGFPIVGDKNNAVMRSAPDNNLSEEEIWEKYKKDRLDQVHKEVGPPRDVHLRRSRKPVLVPKTKRPVRMQPVDPWSAPAWRRLSRWPTQAEWLNRNI